MIPDGTEKNLGFTPQRYSVNARRYAERGGLMRPAEDAHGFLTEQDNRADMARFWFFSLIFDQLVKEGLTGDLAELGVYRGHTASLLAIMARRLGTTVRLLDTFSGFAAADLKGVDAGVAMGFADTSVEAVRTLTGDDNVQFVQGYFPDTAERLPADASYCLVHLDCDLYAPMATALDYFYPRLVPGGFLVVHDYSSLHWDGAERAVHEFLADKSESLIPMPDSGGSAVIRKARPVGGYANWYVRRNAALFGHEWTEAGNDGLAAILTDGWSSKEDWGVWGLGHMHTMNLFVAAPLETDIQLEFDVSAFLLENATRRVISCEANGQPIGQWTFTDQGNRAVRKLRIPRQLSPSDKALPTIPISFRPTAVAQASNARQGLSDQRELGLALHRVRRIA